MNINVNIEELTHLFDKLNMYKKNEISSFSKMIDLFNNINDLYKGPINNEIKSMNDLIYMNFKTIGLNHENDLNYISTNIANYKEALIYSRNKFENIGDIK